MSDKTHHKHSKHHHKKESSAKLTDTQKSTTTSIFEDLESAKRMVDKYSVYNYDICNLDKTLYG